MAAGSKKPLASNRSITERRTYSDFDWQFCFAAASMAADRFAGNSKLHQLFKFDGVVHLVASCDCNYERKMRTSMPRLRRLRTWWELLNLAPNSGAKADIPGPPLWAKWEHRAAPQSQSKVGLNRTTNQLNRTHGSRSRRTCAGSRCPVPSARR